MDLVYYCVTDSCEDGSLNGDESDVDCGGLECDPCGMGDVCERDRDCESGLCEEGHCTESCEDGRQNGDETDVDCGGDDCDPCGAGSGCATHTDCGSNSCREETCVRGVILREDWEDGRAHDDGEVVFEEDWEDGNAAGWETTYNCGWGVETGGTHGTRGTYSMHIGGRSHITKSLDLSEYTNITISYEEAGHSFDGAANICESVRLDFYDGTEWHNDLVHAREDSFGWRTRTYDIPNEWLHRNNRIRFFFHDEACDGCCCGDHYWVDNIRVISGGWQASYNCGWGVETDAHYGTRGDYSLHLGGRSYIYRAYDLSDYSDIQISYWESGWSFDGAANICESVRLDFYDGTDWHNDLRHTQDDHFDWVRRTYDIPDDWLGEDNIIRFFFHDEACDGCCCGDHWWIDDIEIAAGGGIDGPTCFDRRRNGDETDTDCGGDDCRLCSLGDSCAVDSDCETNNCDDGTCEQNVIFTENWEDGNDSGWSTSYRCGWGVQTGGTYGTRGRYSMHIGGRSSITKELDLSVVRDITIIYWEAGHSFDGPANYCESVQLEFYDGSAWHPDLIHSQEDHFGWRRRVYHVPDGWLTSNSRFRFLFHDESCDGCCCGDHWWVDDIQVISGWEED